MMTQLVTRMKTMATGGTFKELSSTSFKTLLAISSLVVMLQVIIRTNGQKSSQLMPSSTLSTMVSSKKRSLLHTETSSLVLAEVKVCRFSLKSSWEESLIRQVCFVLTVSPREKPLVSPLLRKHLRVALASPLLGRRLQSFEVCLPSVRQFHTQLITT